MQVMIDENYLITYAGNQYSGTVPDGSYLFDTEDALSEVVRKEIIRANRWNIPSDHNTFSNHILSTFKREINMNITKTLRNKIIKIYKDEKASDDDARVMLVQSGIPFNKATKVFETILEDAGLKISMASIQNIVDKLKIKTDDDGKIVWDSVVKMIEEVREKLPEAVEKNIITCIRKRFRQDGISFPAKRQKRVPINKRIQDWMLSNASATSEELEAFIIEEVGKTARFAKRWVNIFDFAKSFAGTHGGKKKGKKNKKGKKHDSTEVADTDTSDTETSEE